MPHHQNEWPTVRTRVLYRKAAYTFDVQDYGAEPATGLDDSAAIQEAMTAATGGVCFMPPGVYRANDLVLPAATTLIAERVTIERHAASGAPVLRVSDDCYVVGLTVDGRDTTLVGGTLHEHGIYCPADRCTLERVTSTRNYKHGIYTDGDYWTLDQCVAYENGENPGPSGTGDGFHLLNGNYGEILNCRGYDNARTGIVATTWDGSGADRTLSTYVSSSGCTASGNGYNQVNFEAVTFAEVSDLRVPTGGLSMSSSDDCTVKNLYGTFYALASDRIAIDGVEVRTSDPSSAFFLSGIRPRVSNIHIVGSGGTYTSNAVEVIDTTDYAGIVSGVTVDFCYNGVVMTGMSDVNSIRVTNNENTAWRLSRAAGTGSTLTSLISVVDSKITGYMSAAPASNYWAEGDRVYDTTPSSGGSLGWVCVEAGSPGTWKTFGVIAS